MADETGFASWQSYWRFRQEVTRRQRYLLSDESKAFLDELARTSKSRLGKIDAGVHFCRAQIAHQDVEHPQAGPIPGPALPKRMTPLPDAATEGRANPKGIPRLYLADDSNTAIAEVRPWIGSLVSVSYLRTLRQQRIVDCRDDSGAHHIYLEGEPSPEKREAAVWSDVARAFRMPVQRSDDRAEYAPTQIIVELFQSLGYDGVIYGSAFGSKGSNLVLFDVNAAEIVSTELHEVEKVELKTKEAADPYFVEKQTDGSVRLIRNVITAVGPAGGPMVELT
ncbi:MAG TPA: RES family NAD+ phosphorylase [Allosphingosinicella sp.]|nr:RES family NAD+ phosphorylase [Allosphingosinicella sp.]